jgi:hypothetical protein
MARAIWTGSLNFGLVSIPVGLYSASEDHTVHFHQFQHGTTDRIRYQRVNERTGKEVDYADIAKGSDIGGGDFVIVEPEGAGLHRPRPIPKYRHHQLRRPGRDRPRVFPEGAPAGTDCEVQPWMLNGTSRW